MPDQVELIAAIDAYADQAYGSEGDGGELSRQRALAIDAFQGKNIEPAPEGTSQVVDWAVFETIQWILPSLCRIFCNDSNVVEFEPIGPDDEDAAEQESDVLNYLVTQKNNWFLTCLTMFQDALLTKNAYCMVSMEEKLVPEIEEYEKQSEEQITLLLEDDLEIIEQRQYNDPEDEGTLIDPSTGQPVQDEASALGAMVIYQQQGVEPQIQYKQMFDVKVKRVKPIQKLRFDVLPPEKCLVGEDTPDFSLVECNFFEYYEKITISELRKMGYEIEDDIGHEDSGYWGSQEDEARDEIYYNQFGDTESPDPSMRQVKCRTVWIRYDYDDDGIAELQKVVLVGREVLEHEPASCIPVASIVPFINTHRHIGISVADLTFDIQRIKTALLRQGLNSLYLANQPRHYLNMNNVNGNTISDLTVARAGSVVRGNGPGPETLMPLQTENIFPYAQQGLQHMESVTEARVGVNRVFQGIDQNAMSSTNNHNAIGQLSTMASQRVEQIARIFGNGIERLFAIAHELILKSGHSMEAVKLRGKWIDVDPTTWRSGRDMRVVAPFAAGNKDSLLQRLMMLGQIQEKAAMGGSKTVDDDDIYHLELEIAAAMDVSGTKFFTDPSTVQPQPPPPDHTMIALEIEKQKVDNEAQDEARKAELETFKTSTNAELDKYKAELNAQVQIVIAQLKGGQTVDIENLKAQLRDAPINTANDVGKQNTKAIQELNSAVTDAVKELNAAIAEVKDTATAPIKIVRDKGKIIGKEVNGKFVGIEDAK